MNLRSYRFSRRACSAALFLGVALASICAYAQPTAGKHAPPTTQKVGDFIKSDATLSSGFETPTNKAQVRVVKAIPGGMLANYAADKVKGTIQITGPGDLILDKNYVQWCIDFVLEQLGGSKSAGANCHTEQTTTTTTTNGSTTTTTTQKTVCSAG